MKQRAPLDISLGYRILVIAAVTAVMLVSIMATTTLLNRRRAAALAPPPAGPLTTGLPIAAEAGVFRTRPGDVAIDAVDSRRPAAHRRTLAMYRELRAYPGAPPRIPHGLTAEEFRMTGCNPCHERGGYVARFAAYAPVTPHPEYADCLQCHLADAATIGVDFPDPRPDAVCLQCHAPGDPSARVRMEGWRAAAWPEVGQQALEDGPPLIPHDLHLRGNCLACHLGPGAVEEIRTTHPERSDCRQCHLPAGNDAMIYVRVPVVADPGVGGSR